MKYTVAICDDSREDRDFVGALTASWATQNGHECEIASFASAESFLFNYSDKCDYDILLLDIEMGDMDGVTMAKKLRAVNDTVEIIFITGYSDYISEGYEVAALHYLMKPLDRDKLFSTLDRAADKHAKNERTICLDTGDEMIILPVRKIRYAEVYGNYVTIHADSAIKVKMTLAELEGQLDSRFLRVSRQAIVNLTEISRVTKGEIKLHCGDTIPLPRGAYDTVNRAIINMR